MLNNLKQIQQKSIGWQVRNGGSGPYSISQKRLATGVGLTAIGLPAIMLVSAYFEGGLRNSISHYYYASVQGGIFMVMLAFIGTFLIAYESKFVLETVLARVAGAFAFGIALFPTSGAGFENSTQLFRPFGTLQTNEMGNWSSIDAFTPFCSIAQWLSWVHYGCAAGLFLFLLYYSLVIFPAVQQRQRVGDQPDAAPNLAKQRRNSIYYLTGALIAISMAALALKEILKIDWDQYNLTFWFEALALVAFGIAWIVKGRIVVRIKDPDELELQQSAKE